MDINKFTRFADSLLDDRPVKELGTNKILCYRCADDRERQAREIIVELIELVQEAKYDLEKYAICGTCKSYDLCRKRYKKRQDNVSMEFSPGCYKWKWRGGEDVGKDE